MPCASPSPVDAANYIITAAYSNLGTASAAFQLNGNATAQPGYLRLTQKAAGLWGSAFRKQKVEMPANMAFNAYFTFKLDASGVGSPADGIVFVIQGSTNTAGGVGQDLGFTGINPGFGIEFDTFRNDDYGDPNANHVGIVVNGSCNHTASGLPTQSILPFTLANNILHHAWIDYDGTNIQVRLANNNNRGTSTLVLNAPYNITALFGANRDMYFGFTGSTGGAWEENSIYSGYFNNNNSLGGIDLSTNTYTSGPATVTLTATPASLAGNLSSQVCALVKDEFGAVMANQTINFTTTLGTLSPATAVSNTAGLACVNLNGPNAAGTSTVRGTHAAGAYGEATVTWTTPPPPSPPPANNPISLAPHGAATTNSYSPPAQPVSIPNLQILTAALSASRVAPGEEVTVTASVANRSTVNGIMQVKLYLNGQEETARSIAVSSGQTMPVSFTVSRSEPGIYSVYVGGVPAGGFEVNELADPNMILYASGALILFALVAGMLFITRKRR
jgi:hypothetical protein